MQKLILVAGLSSLIAAHGAIPDFPNCDLSPARKVNWAGCDKSNLNLNNYDLQFSDFSATNFKNTTFVNANLSGSIFIGANLSGVDFSHTKLDAVMWSDGRLCASIDSHCHDRLALNLGYALLKGFLNQPNISDELRQYYRRQLRGSIAYNIDHFTFSYKIAQGLFKEIKEQSLDPILQQPFNDNDQVIILNTYSGKHYAFLRTAVLDWIKAPLCNFANPLTNEALNFVIKN